MLIRVFIKSLNNNTSLNIEKTLNEKLLSK